MTITEIEQLSQLIRTMRHLRSEQGCEWDRAQTPQSLRSYILEEAYELVDAIDGGDTADIKSELGDLLLQVVFQAQIHSELDQFGIGDIAAAINSKLLRRHPHIFADPSAEEHPDWEQIKQQELREKGKPTDLAARLPASLPTLMQAEKICRHLKTKGLLSAPDQSGHESDNEAQIGAALFNLVIKAQEQGIDSDLALRKHLKSVLARLDETNSGN